MLTKLATRQLIVVTGKGGVGKTTLTAALGRLLAGAGRRTLLLETDPRESLHQLLGTPPSAGQVLSAGTRLYLQNLSPKAVVEGLAREKIPIRPLANAIVGHPVFQHFIDGAPGMKEMAVLGYALRTVQGDYKFKADVVVLDAPATGHSAAMLQAPLLLGDMLGGGQLGEMAKDLARFIADPRRCGVILASLAEEMPVQETLELVALLESRLQRPPEQIVMNALYPPVPARGVPASDPLARLWRDRRAVNEQELARLRAEWQGPVVELPLLPLERGPALLDALAIRLEEQIG